MSFFCQCRGVRSSRNDQILTFQSSGFVCLSSGFETLKLLPHCWCSPRCFVVSWIIFLTSPFAKENLSKCQHHHSWDVALNILKDIDLMAFSYMCLETLPCDDMIDFKGFHHTLSSCAFLHVSNIFHNVSNLHGSARIIWRLDAPMLFASQQFKGLKWEESISNWTYSWFHQKL